MPDSSDTYVEANRIAWDAIAERAQANWPAADFFVEGGSLLSDHELEVAGDARGLRLCHLQCGSGEHTLSWANQGALVVGVDVSPKQIELAKRKATAAGISARFIAADVSAVSNELKTESFDIVYTGGGALMWLPDLDQWAATIVNLLRPKGRLILNEEHPLMDCLAVRDGHIEIIEDYFDRKPQAYTGWTHFPGAEDATETKWEFSHPLGVVVTSLAQARLRIERLDEFPSDAKWRFGDELENVRRIGGSYVLVASKAGAP